MSTFNETDFKDLASINDGLCISIFLPTHIKGKEVLEKENQKQLKSQWTSIKKELEEKNISDKKIQKMDKKIQQLMEDPEFWRHQDEGLAIFITPEYFSNFRVPIHFSPSYYILNHAYLLPLTSLLSEKTHFYILKLSLKDVAFYKASKQQIKAIEIEDLAPNRLEERVGFDYKEKSLQARNLSSGDKESQFHGHGGSNRNENAEIKQFFSAVDKGIHSFLASKEIPLVVACDEHLFPIYQEANTYTHLWKKPAKLVSPTTEKELLTHALEALSPYFEEDQQASIEQYTALPPSQTSSSIHDILPAAFEGKIADLFINKDTELWGNYQSSTQSVKLTDKQENINTDENEPLLNKAAIQVIQQGGKVYLLESWDFLEDEQPVHAVFRY